MSPWTPIDPDPPTPPRVPGWWAQSTVGLIGIPSAEAFGSLNIGFFQPIDLVGIPSAEAFGSLGLVYPQGITLTGIPSGEAFGGSTASPGAVTVILQGIPSGEAVGDLTASPGPATVALTGIPSGEMFGNATLTRGPVDVELVGIPSAEAVGDISVAPVVALQGIPSQEAFGDLAASMTVALTGIPSSEAFGDLTVIGPPQPVVLQGIPSSEAFGGSTVSPGAVNIGLQGIPSGEAVGSLAVTTGPVTVGLQGIPSGEAFGTLSAAQNVVLQGIASAEAFGAMKAAQNVVLTGIASGEAFGTLDVDLGAPATATYVNAHTQTGTSITIPAHQVGDLIIIFAYNQSSGIPGKPAAGGTVPAWEDVGSASATYAVRTVKFVATATNHTSGVWSSTVSLAVAIVRNQSVANPIGGQACAITPAANTINAPAVTMTNTDGTSVLLHFYGHWFMTGWSAAPAGYTRRHNAGSGGTAGAAVNTKNSTTADGSIAQPCNTSGIGGGGGATIEVRAY